MMKIIDKVIDKSQKIKQMQKDTQSSLQQFRQMLSRIDWLYHIREFKSISQSKILHLKTDPRLRPSDYYPQMRRLLLHMIYLYYVSYLTKTDFYLYPHICINKWGIAFYYYSLNYDTQKFMQHKNHQDFHQNVRLLFINIWNIQTDSEQDEDKIGQQTDSDTHLQKQYKHPWKQFADQFVHIFSDSNLTQINPKDIICKLQQTRHMKDNILIVALLSSAILPCIKSNKTIQKHFKDAYEEEPSIMKKIFREDLSNQGTKDFVNLIIRFFKILNDFKILGITTTISDKSNIVQEDDSLLTQFYITLGRTGPQLEPKAENLQMSEQINPTSNKSSEHDYIDSDIRYFGKIKCQYFWRKKIKPRELTYRVTIIINKKICPLYFEQIQQIWEKLTSKWKVILDEKKQLSSFNPGFILLSYNKSTYQLSFTEYVKCQPFQNSLSQLILTTDKLIMATLVMKETISFYEKKSLSFQINQDELILNEGRLNDSAQSVCLAIKNYQNYSVQVINEAEMRFYQN